MQILRRNFRNRAILGIAAFGLVFAGSARGNDTDFFESKIRPLLVEKCYSCHSAGAKELKGELHLDTKQGVAAGGKDGPVISPGDPSHSRLIDAVLWKDQHLQMPPKQRLSDSQIADLVMWVKLGAPDPREAPAGAARKIDFAAARRMWAYHPPQPPAIPEVRQSDWCKSPIDRFILARLEDKGLHPAPPADRATLVRRAYFDLIGLPPTPEQVHAFVNDASPDAFATVVDRLLASPQYGQRWARHWLDVVRYTDSFDSRGVGSEGDCADAWRYRDWVVRSFNDDLPYDEFVRQQVAGDLLPAKAGGFNADGLVATEMYVIGNWPGGDADRKKMITDIVDDQIDVTGRAFLGLTLACARCHDHKFDPIPTADYYGLAGIFFSTHFMPAPGSPASGGPLLHMPLASPAEIASRKKHDERVAELKTRIDAVRSDALAALAREAIPKTDQYLAAAWEFSRRPVEKPALSLERFAAERQLDASMLSRWLEFLQPMLSPAQARHLLSTPRHNVQGISGLDGWTGPVDQPPDVLANATDHVVKISTLTIPPRSVTVHPGQHSGVAVGWKSPADMTISIRGRVIDADATCGNGIDWAISKSAGRTMAALCNGSFPNGGRQEFSAVEGAQALNSVKVRAGDFVQVAVYPKGDYSCDTTVVELEIAESGDGHHTWNLSDDILSDVLVDGKGNPHADALGNAGVWQFYEIPDESLAGPPPRDSALAKWAEAATGDDFNRVAAASSALRDALLAIDARADELRKSDRDLSTLSGADSQTYRELVSGKGPFTAGPASGDASVPAAAREKIAGINQELASLQKNAPPPVGVCEALAEGGVPQSMYEGIADAHVHIRGRYDRLGDVVPRHFPRLLAGDNQPAISHGSGRIELANFLTSRDNPLTARVMVNRLWQHHFDDGIVRTPNNYGKLGVPPTHPELLDYLAIEFMNRGWSIKTMQREIMLSAAYQQASTPESATLKADPDDLLFGWMKRRRLEAETIRDNLLMQAGQLDLSLDGPAIRDVNTRRRTLYLMTIRSERSDYRTLFDAADASSIVDQRIDSTVAPQALYLMNSPIVLDQARAIAARALKEGPGDDRGRIEWLYRRLYSRTPTPAEVNVGIDLLTGMMKGTEGAKPVAAEPAWAAYCQVLVCANEFVYVD